MSSPEQTHHLLGPLVAAKGAVWGHESEASFAIKPTGTAVVFVHGFGGSAVGTWLEFPTVLGRSSRCGGSDLFFFGYKSKRRDAAYSASILFRFLSALGTDPSREIINPSLESGLVKRAKNFQYKHIVICAHSLGAVITRLALLDAANEEPVPHWPRRVRLVFFAPAHMGARIIPLVASALTGISLPLAGGGPLEAFLKHQMPVLTDLDPRESQTLPLLKQRTEKALGPQNKRNVHLRARVLHAEHDRVVFKEPFVGDYPMQPSPGVGHVKVCKPSRRSARPWEFLEAYLP